MHIAVLGPLEAWGFEGPIELGSPRERAVLAVLALRAGTVVTAEALVDAVWGDDPPLSATKNVHTYVSKLRRRLRPAQPLRSTGGGYVMSEVELDADRFEELVSGARCALRDLAAAEAAVQLRQAFDLWRGEPLAELRFSPVLAAEATRLGELRLTGLELQAEAELALGRHVDVVGRIQRHLQEHPLRERLWALLMTALYRCERQAEALGAYRRARDVLVHELGIDPGPELRRLEAQILTQDPALAAPATREPVAEARRAQLPPALADVAGYPLVGRSDELAELKAAWACAAAGRSGLVLLAGEPGVGKTRLAAALADAAARTGGLVLYGRCDPEGLIPYQPVVEALRAYVSSAPLADLRAHVFETDGHLHRVLPELGRRLPDEVEHLPAPTHDRLLLFDAVSSLLSTAARRQPVLLVADDVHWADASTLLLLRHLLRMTRVPLLVVATYRDTEVHASHALAENLALLRREPGVRRIGLAGLPRAAVVELTEQAQLPVPAAALAARIHADTRGNALFVHEVLRHLAAHPAAASESVASALPEGVREVIGRRLATLPEPTTRALAVAALVGRDFDVAVVAAAIACDEEDLLGRLDEAVAAQLLVEVPGRADRYAFPHALVRATLLEELSPGRRVRLHTRIAAVLERLEEASPGSHLVELAHHLGEAAQRDDVARAVEYTRRAADLALRQLAYEDAERFYRRALEMLELLDEPAPLLRCELLLALGEALSRVDQGRARTILFEAADLARATSSPALLGRAAVAASGPMPFDRRSAPEVQLLDEAEAVLAADDPALPDVLRAKTVALVLLEDRDVLEPLSLRAISLARRTGDELVEARAIAARLMVLSQPDEADERLALADELLRRAGALRDLTLAALAQRQRAWGHLDRGHLVQARAAIRAHALLARRTRDVVAVTSDRAYEAMFAGLEGRFDIAEQMVTAFRDARGTLAGFHEGHRGLLFIIRWLQRRVQELEPESRRLAEQLPDVLLFRSELAAVAAAAGRLSEAAQLLDDVAPGGVAALPRNLSRSAVLTHFALAIPLLDDRARAQELYDVLLPLADLNLTISGRVFCGAVSFHLGRLAAVTGRPPDAEAHLRDALRRHREYSAAPWVALTEEALLALRHVRR